TQTTNVTEKETTRDLASSDKMELDTEMNSEASSSLDINAHMGLKASYGPTISVSADFGVDSATSVSDSHQVASKSARETTERTATRLRTQTTELRRSRSRTKMIEHNLHGFTNPNRGHVVGVYRWIDRVETVQLYTYGNRLLLEFNIPE